LTDEAVREIRRRYAAGSITQQALANEYGIANSLINMVVKRKVWRHI